MKHKLLVAAIASALALPFAVAPAFAQQTDQGQATTQNAKEKAKELKTIVVTGSLIPQSQIETASPVITITGAQMQAQGFRNVYDALRSQPIATGSVQDSQSAGLGSFTPGVTTISLFGLDPAFTLILLNGHPLADYPLPYNGSESITDLSSIPTALVDHIDILTGGASSIYGSSAIAGVINIVLKSHMSGFDLDYRAGGYSNGGGQNQRIQISGGHTWNNLDVVYALSVDQQQPIRIAQTFTPSRLNNPLGPPYVAGRDFLYFSPFTGAYVAPPSQSTCDAMSNLFGGTLGYQYRPGHGNYCGSYYDGSGTTILNQNLNANGYLNADYRLNDNTTVYANVLYGFSKPKFGGLPYWSYFNPALANSYSPFSGVFWDNSLNDFEGMQRAFAPEEVGGYNGSEGVIYTHQYNVNVGVKGNFGSSDWGYDAYYNRSQVNTDSYQRWALTQPFNDYYLGPQQGTDPYNYGFPAYTPNLTHFYTPLTPAQWYAMSGIIHQNSLSWQQNVTGTLTNTNLFELPAGPVGFAAIAQWGNQSFNSPPDPALIAGEFNNLTGTQGGGSRKRWALGTEFRIPLLSQLTADVSARYDRYTSTGRTDAKATYKLGLEYRPIDTLLIRGNYATAFRAPDMYSLYQGKSGFYQGGVVDYYQCRLAGYTAANIGNCPIPQFGQIFALNSGNPDLKDITAKSYTAGIVWSPTADFDFHLTYAHISIANEVVTPSANGVLETEADCLIGTSLGGQPYDINSGTCQQALAQVNRFPANFPFVLAAGQIKNLVVQPINVASESLSGIQSQLSYKMHLGRWGDLRWDAFYYVELNHKFQSGPNSPSIDLLHNYNSYEFKTRSSLGATWSVGNWTTALLGILDGGSVNYSGTGAVGQWAQFNGSVKYNIGDNSSVQLIVNNIANRAPPTDYSLGSESVIPPPYYNYYVYNGYGRAYWLNFNTRF